MGVLLTLQPALAPAVMPRRRLLSAEPKYEPTYDQCEGIQVHKVDTVGTCQTRGLRAVRNEPHRERFLCQYCFEEAQWQYKGWRRHSEDQSYCAYTVSQSGGALTLTGGGI